MPAVQFVVDAKSAALATAVASLGFVTFAAMLVASRFPTATVTRTGVTIVARVTRMIAIMLARVTRMIVIIVAKVKRMIVIIVARVERMIVMAGTRAGRVTR